MYLLTSCSPANGGRGRGRETRGEKERDREGVRDASTDLLQSSSMFSTLMSLQRVVFQSAKLLLTRVTMSHSTFSMPTWGTEGRE